MRSLWPREHGAYAQLATPIAAALAVRTPTWPAVLLAVAALGAFLANEPLLVVLGHRGPRMRETDGARARRRLVLLATVALICGATGLVLAPHASRLAAAAIAVPVLALIAFAYRKAQHSLGGETLAALALPSAAIPIALASNVPEESAILLGSSMAFGYAGSVVAIHRVLARKRVRWHDFVLLAIAVAAIAGLVLLAFEWPVTSVAIPLLLVSAALFVRPPHARRIRAIGVALVVASVVSLGLAIATT